MKKILLFVFIALLGFTACEKSDLQSSNAVLTGIDFRKCASPYCGGWFIEVNGETLRFFEVPIDTDIELSGDLEFPISVSITWEKYEGDWGEIQDLIKVKKLHKQG